MIAAAKCSVFQPNLQVRRDGNNPRNADISWDDVPGAVGYNILWGLTTKEGDNLYQCYQVFADARLTLELRALNIDQPYSFAIEAFNESGVSKVSEDPGSEQLIDLDS